MKGCEEVVPLIGPLLDGVLDDDDRAWVEDHVSGCAGCRGRRALTLAQAQALREVLAGRAAALPLAGLSERVLARVREQQRAVMGGPSGVFWRELWWAHRGALTAGSGLALAACMAVAVFLGPGGTAGSGPVVADNSPQLEEVDFGTHDGAVLQLAGQTTVIWMSEDKGVPQ
jgi:anti-sigma factor RsiW